MATGPHKFDPTSHELAGTKEAAVGPVRAGTVISIDRELGVGYLEDGDGRRFGVARNFIDPKVFDSLGIGARVYFRENGRNAAAVVIRAE